MNEPYFDKIMADGGGFEWESLDELGRTMSVDTAALAETLKQYNQQALTGGPDQFGRADFGLSPLKAPFVACRIIPGLNATQRGLCVDTSARPITAEGEVIQNLFAGGGVAAGVSGRSGGKGDSSGNGLLSTLALGRIAGRSAAMEVLSEESRQ